MIENNEKDQVEIARIDPGNLYVNEKANIDVQVSTAHQYPRTISRAVANSIQAVTLNEEVASTCTYSVPRGGKAITGPSVHLAKIIVQNWGNIRVGARVISVGEKDVTSEAVCWDLENNIAIQTSVKRSIMTRKGRMTDDMIVVTGNATNSIALRNAVFSVVPRYVTDMVYNAAIQKITGDLSDENKLIAKRIKVINALKETYSVSENEILSAIGKESISHVGAGEIATLIGIGQAIKDGDASVNDSFRRSKNKPNKNNLAHDNRVKIMKDWCANVTSVETIEKWIDENSTAGSDMLQIARDRMFEILGTNEKNAES